MKNKKGGSPMRRIASSAKLPSLRGLGTGPRGGTKISRRLVAAVMLGTVLLLVKWYTDRTYEIVWRKVSTRGSPPLHDGSPSDLGTAVGVRVNSNRNERKSSVKAPQTSKKPWDMLKSDDPRGAEWSVWGYYMDENDPRNIGVQLMDEPEEQSCFADNLEGTKPIAIPDRAPLYVPEVWPSSPDGCAEALNVDKVAILLMAKGSLHHSSFWRQWFASAAGRIPVVVDGSCAVASSVESAGTQEACGSFLAGRRSMPSMPSMPSILDDPIAHQLLFNVYVHVPTGNEDQLDALFRPYLIPRRVVVEWGKPSMIYAMRELLWFGFQDPRNARFILLSESDVPLYGPLPFYRQLMAETKSRVDLKGATDQHRRTFRFMCGNPRIRQEDWRKSSQWFTLIRDHAELVLQDTGVFRVFERFCHDFWDHPHGFWRSYVACRCCA